MEQLFTLKEVAEYLKMSLPTIYTLINKGELQTTKLGGSVRIKATDLLDFVERGKQ